MFVPKNEQGVFYLFSTHHKELGFEKIIDIGTQFPDVTALREGNKVRVELEFLLSSFKGHYVYKKATDEGYWKWDKENEMWRIFNPNNNRFLSVSELELKLTDTTRKKLGFPSAKVIVKDNAEKFSTNWKGELIYKTLKGEVDFIICWEKDCDMEDDIEVIVLKDELTRLTSVNSYEIVVSLYVDKMNELLAKPRYSFSEVSSVDIPREAGVYAIHDKRLEATIYIGRTRNLRRRLLRNHKSGNIRGSQFRKALGQKFALKTEANITDYLLENCRFQFMVVKEFEEMVRLEHFATAVLAPVLNVQLRQ